MRFIENVVRTKPHVKEIQIINNNLLTILPIQDKVQVMDKNSNSTIQEQ